MEGIEQQVHQAIEQNGSGRQDDTPPAPARPAGPRAPGRREVWITMPGEYGDAGFRIKMWATYPHRLANMIASGDPIETEKAMTRIILGHNDWRFEDDTPMPLLKPPPISADDDSPEFQESLQAFTRWWDGLTQELSLAISTTMGMEVSKLMTSVANRRRR